MDITSKKTCPCLRVYRQKNLDFYQHGLRRLFLRVLRTRPHHWRPMLQVWITSNGHYTSENMSIFRVFPLLSIQWKPGPLGVLVLELFLGVLRTRPHHLWPMLQVWITSNDRNGFLGSLPSPTQRCSLFPTMLAWKKHQGFTWQELRDPSTRPYHFRAIATSGRLQAILITSPYKPIWRICAFSQRSS